MDIKKAAKALGVGDKTMRNLIKSGSVQARKVDSRSGPRYEIDEEALELYKAHKAAGAVMPTVEKDGNQAGKPGSSLVKLGPGNLPSYQALPIPLAAPRFTEPLRFPEELPLVMTIREVAQCLGVGESQVRAYIKSGKLRSAKMGRGYKISKDSLRAFIKKVLG